jgi:CheY-like chemotaxis protein
MIDPQKPKVLVVDDELIIADTLAMILNRSGYEARATYCGETAVQIASRFEPDMLISDVFMPGITGIEAAIKIRAALPSCRVLLFSGQAASVNLLAKACIQDDEFEILLKPVHPADLLARLHKVLPISDEAQVRGQEVA